MPSFSTPTSAKQRGKRKQLIRDEGQQGTILPLEVVQNSIYNVYVPCAAFPLLSPTLNDRVRSQHCLCFDAALGFTGRDTGSAYTLPVLVGTSQQNLSLQVDTGSSDLWIASTSCSTSDCGKTNGRLYNPSQATQTGRSFSIQYLQGNVSGPIVWDQVQIGAFTISNQALAAADNVLSEPLSQDFQGVLGLALPLNSVIADAIPPVTGNSADGAAFASNLFGITPSSAAPSARFLSLSLSRPGSDQIPSLLGIGRHPPEIVSDPSKINYAVLVSERRGIFFWKATVRAITMYVDGQAKPISLGPSASGGVFPSATLDTGVPLILTTSAIANGIYGAIGINPANDGQYYVPCTQPLNLTITLDNRPEIPIHPLDLTGEPPEGAESSYCIGLIQTADAQLANPTSDAGDIILGVPFLRNVYTVMAYDPPDTNGAFYANHSGSFDINPRLGLLNLTDPNVAIEEFKRVRVYNQPLSPSSPPPSPASPEKKMSVGIDVLIGLVSFVALCFILFAGRWFLGKGIRRKKTDAHGKSAYHLTRRDSQLGLDGPPPPSGDTRRHPIPYDTYLKKDRMTSEYTTTDSARTRVNSDVDAEFDDEFGLKDGEMGYRKPRLAAEGVAADAVDPWDETLVVAPDDKPLSVEGDGLPDSDEGLPTLPRAFRRPHPTTQRTPSVSWPLLVHNRGGSHGSEGDDLAEFGVEGRESMAGIGTAARGSRIDPGLRQESISSLSGIVPLSDLEHKEKSPPRPFLSGTGPLLLDDHTTDA